jgi:hypothetical protein
MSARRSDGLFVSFECAVGAGEVIRAPVGEKSMVCRESADLCYGSADSLAPALIDVHDNTLLAQGKTVTSRSNQ